MDDVIEELDRAVEALERARKAADLPHRFRPEGAGKWEEAKSLHLAINNARHAREMRSRRHEREEMEELPSPFDERSAEEQKQAREYLQQRLSHDLRAACEEIDRNFVALAAILDEYRIKPHEVGLTHELEGEVQSMVYEIYERLRDRGRSDP